MDPDAGFSIDEAKLLQFEDLGLGVQDGQFEPAAGIVWGQVMDSDYSEGEAEGNEEVERNYQSLKRRAEDMETSRPFKRQRGVLNMEYLDLLNREIEDAAHRVCLADEVDVESSQIGLTYWTEMEKNLFFEAIARFGRDDTPGISARIGTKSVIEVRHYLAFLQNAQRLRRADGLRPAIEFAEYPAAVELSQQCCHALDEAADAVSVRQERREEQREEGKWGDIWEVDLMNAKDFEKGRLPAESKPVPSAQLFHFQNWLQLSERIFMNSSIPGDNWHFIDERPPSIWTTTFEDFYSLAVSFTRRLIQTTLFISMSRIRAKKELNLSTRNVVRKKDAEAAIACLGIERNSFEFWRKSARRLRLDVYEEPPQRDEEGEEESALAYDEIEEALLVGKDDEDDHGEGHEALRLGDLKVDSASEASAEETDEDSEVPWTLSDEEGLEVDAEADEILQYSAADYPDTNRKGESLKIRIATEREQEEYAEARDQFASTQAEAEMWEVLQRRPPMELPKMQELGPQPRSKMDLDSIYPIGENWRSKMRYRSEWESKEEASK